MSALPAGITGLPDDIARWRRAMPARAPSYHCVFEQLVAILDERSREAVELVDRLGAAWAHRTFRIFYDRPLLLIASLRNQALVAGPQHPLWFALAAPEPDPDSVTRSALLEALADDAVFALLRDNFVQTNETSRALVWLWPAQLIGCSDGARPLALVEVGTAAGLNLVAERLASPWTDATGAALPAVRAPNIATRLGIDAHPLDACTDRDANWLRACVWAGEHARIARLETAIAAFRAAPVTLRRGDVTDAPHVLRATTQAAAPERGMVLAFQTLVRDYLAQDTRARYEHEMHRWIADSPIGSALWVELEVDYADRHERCAILAHVRDENGPTAITLGKTSPHPAVVDVDAAAVERLTHIFH
jgi:hypothetical protein